MAQEPGRGNSQSRVADGSNKMKTEITSTVSSKKQLIMLTEAVSDVLRVKLQ